MNSIPPARFTIIAVLYHRNDRTFPALDREGDWEMELWGGRSKASLGARAAVVRRERFGL
jgi:hypothetical protein